VQEIVDVSVIVVSLPLSICSVSLTYMLQRTLKSPLCSSIVISSFQTCSKTGCSQVNSFLEETCYHVVMSGISDPDLLGRESSDPSNAKDLPSLLNYVAAEESARSKNGGVH
jgi:hypothetical protein